MVQERPDGLPASAVLRRLVGPHYLCVVEGLLAGEAPAVVAARVGVDPTAVPALLRLAAAKLLDALEVDASAPPCPVCGR